MLLAKVYKGKGGEEGGKGGEEGGEGGEGREGRGGEGRGGKGREGREGEGGEGREGRGGEEGGRPLFSGAFNSLSLSPPLPPVLPLLSHGSHRACLHLRHEAPLRKAGHRLCSKVERTFTVMM